MTASRLRALLLVATALLAALVLVAWSQPWFVLELSATSGDPAPLEVRGDVAAAALVPLALTVLAIVAALALAGPMFRIVFGALEALVGACIVAVTAAALAGPVAASASAVTEATGHARLRRVADGEVDAVVLAAAGLRRLGRAGEITQTLPPELMLPAPAQGALAVECRSGEHSLVDQLKSVNDEHSRAAVDAGSWWSARSSVPSSSAAVWLTATR